MTSLVVDFDNAPDARYEISLHPDDAESGDGVVLSLNRRACVAFANLFTQLAEQGGHVHLGYTEEEPQGPGWRIVVKEEGRSGT